MKAIRPTNPLREQVIGTPDAILAQFDRLENQARLILSTPEIFALRQIYLTGCGDSQMAGASVEMAFEQFADVPVEALRAMEASRYALPALGTRAPGALVIGISSSGTVARTAEAVEVARRLGAKTIALTSKPESPVGQAAGIILQMESASLPSAPGFYGYILSIVALNLLAIRMAEVKGRLTQDGAFSARQQLKSTVEAIPRVVTAVDPTVRDLATEWASYDNIEFLGSGPSYATAAFGAAKMLEASGTHALAQDMEEWAHLQYFVAKPESTATFLIAPSGAKAESRAVEISKFLHTLERPSLAIVGAESPIADYRVPTLPIPEMVEEPFSPILYSIPLALFAGYLADATGAEYGRGHTGRWIDSDMGISIRESRIVIP